MKRRVIKKNINRFITPLIKDLPITTFRGWEIKDNGYGMEEVHEGLNHTIIDGFIVSEGCIPPQGNGFMKSIKRTTDTIKNIRSSHNKVFLRIKPEFVRGHIYMRIITEKVE